MSRNQIGSESEPVTSNSQQTPTDRSASSSKCLKKKRLLWIIIGIIVAIVIVTFATMIIMRRTTTNKKKTSNVKKKTTNIIQSTTVTTTKTIIVTNPTTTESPTTSTSTITSTTTSITTSTTTSTITSTITSTTSKSKPKFDKWKEDAITVAGGNGDGQQLNYPVGIFIDEKKNIFIADQWNHRIVEWKYNAKEGQLIAGGKGRGAGIDQLDLPTDVIVDQQNHSIIIADKGNRRVIQWLDQNQQILIDKIDSYGLATDKHGFLYVCNREFHEVRRWKMGEYNNEGIVVAGGNGQGDQLNQLNNPTFIFVDEEQSVYVSDPINQRVMKWRKDAQEGTIVAGGNGKGGNLTQLSSPEGVIVDDMGQIYVADFENDRVMRWCEGKEEGEIVAGGNRRGDRPFELNGPLDLSFDDEGNLYVVDFRNQRIQKFETTL
ncbi:unnamed protein product [Adineta steineri]|uniref:NHL repeat containing protein-like protein n=1 Tax=Adineta steineri TaxID=433720 RepID=A0A819E2U3_9BILA|nr:unnamed protein product [Adineta steineri]CAF3861854.1 unnamed protein product [Adineta steineri]